MRCRCRLLCPLSNTSLTISLRLSKPSVANITLRLNSEVKQGEEIVDFFFHARETA